MNFPQICGNSSRFGFLLAAVAIGVGARAFGGDTATPAQPRQALFQGLDPSKVDYYFGNLDERRVTWSMGRDLLLQPPQENGPVNALVKMYVEIAGKPSTDWTRDLSYTESTKQ